MLNFLDKYKPVFDTGEGGGGGGDGGSGEGGGEAPPFLDSITDPDARGLVEKKGYGSANDIAVAYRHMVQLHGKAPNVVALPEGDDDTDGWNNLYGLLGRPDTPENYAYDPGEGAEANTKFLDTMRAAAHTAGITQKQFEALTGAYDGFAQTSIEEQQALSSEQSQQQETEIIEAFGGERKFETVKAAGSQAVKALGLDEDTLDAIDATLGVPATMKLLATIGSKLGEADFLEGIDVNGQGMSQVEAKSEMDRLKGDTGFQASLLTPTHANHKANTSKWAELQRIAFSSPRGGRR